MFDQINPFVLDAPFLPRVEKRCIGNKWDNTGKIAQNLTHFCPIFYFYILTSSKALALYGAFRKI